MKKIIICILLCIFISLLISMPSTASNTNEAFFLCEKTDSVSGEPIMPHSPQYDNLDYNHPFVDLGQTITRILFILLIAIGILGGLYATIRNSLFTPESDDDPAKYVRMRIKLMTAGLGIPIGLTVIGWIIERITVYEVTCLLPI